MNKIIKIAAGDFKQRTRKYNFLIVLCITIFSSVLIIPSNKGTGEAFYLLINDTYKPLYNSEFVGTAGIFMATFLISLFGFYIINNSIGVDRDTKVGEIIASTSISKTSYLFGKALSNFAVLGVILFIDMIVIIIMYLIYGQASMNIMNFIIPFVALGLPTIFFVSSLGIICESIKFLRGTLGNILYFFIWTAITVTGVSVPKAANTLDLLGIRVISDNLQKVFPASTVTGFSWSYRDLRKAKATIWDGIDWNAGIFLKRLIPLMLGIVIVIIAVMFFDRFSKLDRKVKISKKNKNKLDYANIVDNKRSSVSVSQLLKVSFGFNLVGKIKGELKLMTKGISFWVILLEIVFNVLCIFTPLDITRNYLFPICWILPVACWSSMGCRENKFNTSELIFSCENYTLKQFPALIISGVILAFMSGLGMMIRLFIIGNTSAIVSLLISSLLISSLAVCLGVITGSSKVFELIYTFIWFMGCMGNIYPLNFTDIANFSYGKSIIFLLSSLIFFATSFMFRQTESQ